YGKIDRIDSHTEYWMETEARLRTDFNVAGPKVADLLPIKRKSVMKAAFAQAGVAAPRGVLAEELDDLWRLAQEVGYPLVAKPDIGVGAANTFKLLGPQDVERFWATKPPIPYLVEEFIHGPILTFDGLTDRDGNPVFYTSMTYSQGVMETVNEDRDIYFYNFREIPADLEDAGRRVLQAFGVHERFFHFEFFRSESTGQVIALEVNMRPPGGPIVDMFNYAHDIDLYWEWANIIVNNRFVESYSRKYHCCFVGRKHSKSYAHSHAQIMDAVGYCVVEHQPMPPVFALAMGDYYYLLRSPDLNEVVAAAHFIQELE
ncbi:MAG: hypothetical protein QG637_674, partial [Chloroflexota bacterium]|nr:hypothetical protein [Chloroflexota bacterium]